MISLTLETDISKCRKCESLLAQKLVDLVAQNQRVIPRPIVPSFDSQSILLIGQAPGLTEYTTGKPFQGKAGQGIRKILAEAGIPQDRFEKFVYSTAVVKCFPGSKRVGVRREDEKPSKQMVMNCLPYLRQQLEAYRPQVIITLGQFPLMQYLKLSGGIYTTLNQFIGKVDAYLGATVVFLPHTSGTSRWLNNPEHRALFEKANRTYVPYSRSVT